MRQMFAEQSVKSQCINKLDGPYQARFAGQIPSARFKADCSGRFAYRLWLFSGNFTREKGTSSG
jgi:hypothetical protein